MKRAGQTTPNAQGDATLEVVGLSHDGRGVARADGKTVFVDGALPGEVVRCRVVRSRPRFDEARLLELVRGAPERTEPRCVHYGRCGGCALQHLSSAAQLAARERQLADALSRIAGLVPRAWLPPVASPPYGYRSRARLALHWDSRQRRVTLGFRRPGSRDIEPVDGCAVMVPDLAELVGPLAALIATFAQPARVRELWLASGEPGLALAAACAAALEPRDREALADFCAARDIVLHLGSSDAPGSAVNWVAGGPPLGYAPAEGLRLEFNPWQFTQANRGVNRALVEAVIALLQPRAGDRVLDLFCGLGNFSLPLARLAGHVTGIEGDAQMVECARGNARRNALANTEFLHADLAALPGGSAWARARYDLVVLDPPRSGASALMPALARLRVRRIAYVSCDAATLARDAALLCARGDWTLAHAGVLDMFPQTAHFETLAVFAARV
jgi:23S rRNA (uracil1939-C5)-methyltransferase